MSSTNEEYVLSWNDHGNNLSISFDDFLQGDELVDVKLVAEGQLISAHRLVLSAVSPYFRQMFAQMPVNQQAFVFLKDISKQTVADLIKYIYRGQVNVKQEYLEEFMNAAHALNIKGLADGSYSQTFESRLTDSTPARPTFNESAYQTPISNHQQLLDSAGVQYQSVQRSAQSIQHQQPMNKSQNHDGFDFKDRNHMNGNIGYDLNYEQNNDDGNGSDNYSMNDCNNTLFNQWNIESGPSDNELNTMPTASKRFKTIKGTSKYDILADIRDTNGRERLFHNSFVFGKHYKPNGSGAQRWRCTKHSVHKCHAAVSTMNIDGVPMMKTLIIEHTHDS